MPLPEEVINKLSNERLAAPGWSTGLLWFAWGALALSLVLYAGITFAYEPYLNSQISTTTSELAKVSQSIDSKQEATLLSRYSQLAHVQSMLAGRTAFSPVLTWLSKNTQANTYYTSLSFSENRLLLDALARTEADLAQQIAIFEADPDVQSVNVSNLSLANISGYVQTNITLLLKPSLLATSGR